MRFRSTLLLEWAIRCFGADHVLDRKTRALRILEEAVELAQACGVVKSDIKTVVYNVYDRPIGNVAQEIGGILVTTTVFTAAHLPMSPGGYLDLEILRVLGKPPEHFSVRNRSKLVASDREL